MRPGIRIAVLGLALAVMAPPLGADAQSAGVLRVGTWGGPWRDAINDLVGKWVEPRGVRVEFVLGNPVDNLAKVIAARGGEPPLDVMDLLTDATSLMVRGGYLEKPDRSAIPNLAAVPREAQHELMVAYGFQQDGIIYRGDKFKEHGIPVPTKYGDLVHPKLANRVAVPDVGVSSFWSMLIGLNAESGGDETTIERAIERVPAIKALYYYTSSTELAQKLKMGDVWAAPSHVGWVVRLRRQGLPVDFVHPRVGSEVGIFNFNTLGVVRGTKNRKAAELYINRYLDAEVQAAFLKRLGIMPIVRSARADAGREAELRDVVLWTDEQTRRGHFTDWDKVDARKVRDAWSRAAK